MVAAEARRGASGWDCPVPAVVGTRPLSWRLQAAWGDACPALGGWGQVERSLQRGGPVGEGVPVQGVWRCPWVTS